MATFPNGFIIKTERPEESFLVYNDLDSSGIVTAGFRLFVPNLSHASVEEKNDLYTNLQSYLSRCDVRQRIQFRYEKDSNYWDMLQQYERDTEELASDLFSVKVRQDLAQEIRRKIENNELRREYTYIFLTCKLTDFFKGALDVSTEKSRRNFENAVSSYFSTQYNLLKSAFPFRIDRMDHVDLFAMFYRSVNQSLSSGSFDYAKIFTPYLDEIYLSDFCASPPVSGKSDPGPSRGFCMYGDGLFHNVLIMSKIPSFDLIPFYGNAFIDNCINNFTISVNMQCCDKTKVIEKLEARQAAAQRDLEADPSAIAYQFEVDQLEKTIYRLGAGEDVPFQAEYIVHIWDSDQTRLESNTATLRQIASNLHCDLYMHDLATQSYSIFVKTLPGYTFYQRWGESLFVLHRSFAALIPFNSSFTGCPEKFQALYYGDHNNLVGIDLFYGGTPQHFAVFGQSGSGKSVNVLSLLLQSFPFYGKLVVIEEGASYLMLTRILGGQFIEIDVNSNLCLNYFDTCGTPLNASQLEFVTNFLTCMCGQSKDDELIQDRAAMLTHYVHKIYEASFQEWKTKHFSKMNEIARRTLTVQWMMPNQPMGRNTVLDCFFDLRDALEKEPSARNAVEVQMCEYYSNVKEETITECIIDSGEILRDVTYAFMTPEDMPYHSQLVEMIRSTPELSHKREDTNRIATRLAQYALESGRGCLFDGVTNIDLSNRMLHFELGKMANSSGNFKSLIGLVIGNLVKNQIVNMPRSVWKMYIFEEAQRFLSIPGGDAIMMQSYAQFRKFNCVAATITQEAGQLMTGNGTGSNVGSIVMGQSKEYFFLKNKDKQNLEYFTRYAKLSSSAQEKILNFPSPEHIPGRKYSSWVYYVDNGEYPIVGVVRHYANELTIAVASTSGDAFAKREEEIRRLRILYPAMSEGDLLIEYLTRSKLDDPSIRLLKEMIADRDFSRADELLEDLIRYILMQNGLTYSLASEKIKTLNNENNIERKLL